MNTWSSPCTMSSQNRRPRSSINDRLDQLMRCESPPDAIVQKVCVEHRSARTPLCVRTADPTDACDHDVGALWLRHGDKPPQRIGTEIVVSIVEKT